MRVITGSQRGKRLVAPDGIDVRPTVDRVKEGVFSAIQFDIEGRKVLDLFAGSGQLGIEALSRGAGYAVFVDNFARSLECVRKNLAACGFDGRASVVNSDWEAYLMRCTERFDIVFLDPPYHKGLVEKAAEKLFCKTSDAAILVCETASDEELPEQMSGFEAVKKYRYGKVSVTVYRKQQL